MLHLLADRLRPRPQPPRSRAEPVIRELPALLTPTQAAARDALAAAVSASSALVVLTGPAGCGKTTALASALSRVSDPSLQVVWPGDAALGMEEAFGTLFPAGAGRPPKRQAPERRAVLVTDGAETLPAEAVASIELLTRMPGRDAPVQWVVAGRPEFWRQMRGPVADRLRDAAPSINLPGLSEADAWELFAHRVSAAHAMPSAPRLVSALMELSGGMPGRFDAAVRQAVAAGMLTGTAGRAA